MKTMAQKSDVSDNDSSETQKRILLAAQKEFSTAGFGGARMESIAAAAGVNKALLHYYFRSKKNLYLTILKTVFHSVWSRIQQQLDATAEPKPFRHVIKTVVTVYITTIAENPSFPRIILHEFADGAVNIDAVIKELLQAGEPAPVNLFKTIAQGIKKKGIRAMAIEQIFMNIFGMCAASFILQPISNSLTSALAQKPAAKNQTSFYSERINAITTTLCDGILCKETW